MISLSDDKSRMHLTETRQHVTRAAASAQSMSSFVESWSVAARQGNSQVTKVLLVIVRLSLI